MRPLSALSPTHGNSRSTEFRQQEARDFEASAYSRLRQNATEAAIDELASAADVVFNTERFTPGQLAKAAAALLELV